MIEQFPAIISVAADDHVLLIVQHHGVVNGSNVAGSIRVVPGTERTIVARLLGVDERDLVATEQTTGDTLWTRRGDVELWIKGSDSTRARQIAAVVATIPGMAWADAHEIAEHVPSRVTGGLALVDLEPLASALMNAGADVEIRGVEYSEPAPRVTPLNIFRDETSEGA